MSCSNYRNIPGFWLTVLFLVMISRISIAQEEAKPLSDPAAFQAKLKGESEKIRSVESDFIQEKHLSVFNDKVVLKGKFYFKKENKVRMEYTSPVPYLIIFNNGKLQITSEGKKNVVNISSNPMMNQMKNMIVACMTGDLKNLSSGYTVDYYETSSTYMLKIIPNSKGVQTYISEILITLLKEDMSVTKLRLTESGNDYNEYTFTNRQHNTLVTDEKFTVD